MPKWLAPKLQINTNNITSYNKYVCNRIFVPVKERTYNQEFMIEAMRELPDNLKYSYDISELINEAIDMGI